MPSVLTDHDKETVKRTVPKSANKIHAVAVARLYIAYPNKQQWTYTGLQGAAVLANDLIGNTFWIKLVDVSVCFYLECYTNNTARTVLILSKPANRGVIWDQEIYDTFVYNQDRTFFHSFELEHCLAGLSFADEKEAKQFKKKMDEREKNASKSTKATPFQGHGVAPPLGNLSNEKHHSRLGSLLHGHRPSSASHAPQQQIQSIIPSKAPPAVIPPSTQGTGGSALDTVDPSWRETLSELLELGITEDQIEEHAVFIKSYIEQKQQSNTAGDATSDENVNGANNDRRAKAPPPPPPIAAPGRLTSISPQHTGSSTTSKRGPPPAPPPARKSRVENNVALSPSQPPTQPPISPDRTPSPPRSVPRFRAPPPLADAGKFANKAPSPPSRERAASNLTNPGPPPPPRPPKMPVDEDVEVKPRFGVPPPFQGAQSSSFTPPTQNRVPVPPPPPRIPRDTNHTHSVPPSALGPPPLPPKTPNGFATSSAPPLPPPLPVQRTAPAAPIPPPLPSVTRPVPEPPVGGPPPPPPLPSFGAPPPPPLPSNSAPPPPPLPPMGGPPPPPLPSGRALVNSPSLPQPTGAKEDVLASIRASGGIGGGRLKKVSDQEKRDRSAAAVPGAATGTSQVGNSKPAANASGGGLGDALALALSARNKKVSASGMSNYSGETFISLSY